MVSIMTALYFEHLTSADRVSVKPHAAPVLHAIEFLLGQLDAEYLTTLRAFGGLQSYPSRLKDPVPADFSTGSVGIGATAPIWSAIAHRYVAGHFDVPQAGRQISLVGDAELDEGACWEAIVDPVVSRLGEVLWIVDLNRQSLDRVVPEIAVGRVAGMFEAAGWHVITLKYGRRLGELFGRPGGEVLRRRIDEMPNEEYQRLLRESAASLRERIPGSGNGRREIELLLADVDDDELRSSVRDLGGHDLGLLLEAFAAADSVTDRPTVIFAYTIKAWSLPTEGHPGNHSALLTQEQWATLGRDLEADPDDPWAAFDEETLERDVCLRAAHRLERSPVRAVAPPDVPVDLGLSHRNAASTQQAFGRFLGDLRRAAPEA
ncbi:MAG: pyruvate dehydrogenase component, partial [Gaiellaceae bacterium]|nr:pyruvate dehydrogenase component [Gaiellaceae bacterium]